jgi:hypothetical protein
MRFDLNKVWSRNQCGGITIDYGKYVAQYELRRYDA